MKKNQTKIKKEPGAFNSVQLNIVVLVDVAKATRTNSTEGCVYMMDNNVLSTGQGTPGLQTICKPGQVLNWIIYAMNADQRPDGSWPPSVRINSLVFVDEKRNDVESLRVCNELQILGGPDKVRSKYTPIYYYWAGTVSDSIPTNDVYNYRLVLELETEDPTEKIYLNFDEASLKLVDIDA